MAKGTAGGAWREARGEALGEKHGGRRWAGGDGVKRRRREYEVGMRWKGVRSADRLTCLRRFR